MHTPPAPESSAPEGVDVTTPHSARVWNYWLGGEDNYPVDRELGDQILGIHPGIAVDARAGRAFLVRAVTHLAREEGVRQFLDVGTGLPTHRNIHEIAQSVAPDARIVHVDNDPLVLAHARVLLRGTEEGATAFVDHDLRDTGRVLARAGELLDLDQPVGLSVIGTLGHLPTLEEAAGVVRSYLAGLPSGSFLVVADAVLPDEGSAAEALDEWNREAALAYRGHTPAEFASYFDGLELLDPGVGPTPLWRPEPGEVGRTPDTDMYGAVARKP
ncbi:SAM-dependent methyltransferase [Nocardiopsis sp. B62]|uniref:SAM-dependent methyltransferase n=1 Tax=Nocardiopsis sp. B62 TaxID=2824874 RepID=UPI001B35CCFB|nr:SAM-dependent methyltransferase [Nocardiopsis sp. B62]MBQ1080548.1 SAM-dependent methyltransferase [Nocardiopsis sp. B62]